MKLTRLVRLSFLAVVAAAFAATALAQTPPATEQFKPEVGQAGKDVVWVPTPDALVEKMLDMAKVTAKDYLVDLGSGDGRTVIAAAKRGARALGIEYNDEMVALSRQNAAAAGVEGRAQFRQADLFETDFTQADVLTMFLLTSINLKLQPQILQMRPGTRVVSNTFLMGDWTPDESFTVTDGCTGYCTAHFWVVPARVQGTWQLPQGSLTIKQEFQVISGTFQAGEANGAVVSGRLNGPEIRFTAGGEEYTGRVNGNVMEGTVKSGGASTPWKATRAVG